LVSVVDSVVAPLRSGMLVRHLFQIFGMPDQRSWIGLGRVGGQPAAIGGKSPQVVRAGRIHPSVRDHFEQVIVVLGLTDLVLGHQPVDQLVLQKQEVGLVPSDCLRDG